MTRWLAALALMTYFIPVDSRGADPVASDPPLWVALGDPANGTSLDYNSIRLDGAHPTLLIKEEYKDKHFLKTDAKNPQLIGSFAFTTLLLRSSVDCTGGLVSASFISFLDKDGQLITTMDRTTLDRIGTSAQLPSVLPMAMLRSLCIWKEAGFERPKLSTDESWEEIPSGNDSAKLFEAPAARQRRNGIVLIKKKTVSIPAVTVFGKQSVYAIAVSAYDCAKAESHLTVAVRYDLSDAPINMFLFLETPDTPKLEVNRDRLADSCK